MTNEYRFVLPTNEYRFVLPPGAWEAFTAILERPPRVRLRLRALLADADLPPDETMTSARP